MSSVVRHDYRFNQIHFCKIVHSYATSGKIIHRNERTEESLDLSAAEINRNNPIDSHRLEQSSHICSRDGNTLGLSAVLPRISEIGNDARDFSRTRSATGANHQHQLHEFVVDIRRTRRLNDKNILSTNVFVDFDEHFPISSMSGLQSNSQPIQTLQAPKFVLSLAATSSESSRFELPERSMREVDGTLSPLTVFPSF